MHGCCDARGCDRSFGPGFARRMAKRYRRRGLDKTAARIVAFAESQGVADATVLEIGGGLGEIELELLKRGARSAVNLELSPAYAGESAALFAEAGMQDRAQRRLVDLAVEPTAADQADVVVLHRVVCCYPDYERLLGAAAGRARRLLVFSHPPRNLLSRAIVGTQNAWFRISRTEFRTFAHPPAAMLGVLEREGLEVAFAHRRGPWWVEGLARG